jgi:hypothetical protein
LAAPSAVRSLACLAVSSRVSTSASDRIVDGRARIVGADAFGEEKAEELADGRELSCPRGRRQSFARQSGEIGAEMIGRRGLRRFPLGGKEGEELGKVARIGLDGVGGRAALGGQHVEKERQL